MTTLSPKACRLVSFAMRGADEVDQAIWKTVDKDTRDLSPSAEHAALNALRLYEARLRARLDASGLGEDEVADLSNDLGAVRSIERGLERRQHEMAAAD